MTGIRIQAAFAAFLLSAALFGLAALFVLGSGPAQAVPACMARAELLAALAGRYGEAPVSIGVTGGGGLLEVLAAPGGATWTIVITGPTGLACMAASGAGWRQLKAGDEPALGERRL